MAVSNDVIGFIQKSCQKFIEENQKDELIFFDDFWEIYESHLKTQEHKPIRKWKYKFPRVKGVKFLGISGSTASVKLITPAIIEIITSAYIHIAKIREKLSMERIEETIKRCGKKLPVDVMQQTISFFAPLMLEDLRKAEGIPVEEIEKESEIDSHLEEDESGAFAEKKKYWIYSHGHRNGKELSERAYSCIKDELETIKLQCLLFINEITGEFYVYGDDQIVSDIPKTYLKLLIKNVGCTLNHDAIYEEVTRLKLAELPDEETPDTVQTVYKWNSLLMSKINKKLGSCIKSDRGRGYKICFGKKKKYYLFDYLID